MLVNSFGDVLFRLSYSLARNQTSVRRVVFSMKSHRIATMMSCGGKVKDKTVLVRASWLTVASFQVNLLEQGIFEVPL